MTTGRATISRQPGSAWLTAGLHIIHGLGALAIVYFFLALLMTQMAQYTVVAQIGRIDARLGFSGAYAAVIEDAHVPERIAALNRSISLGEREALTAQSTLSEAQAALTSTTNRFLPIASSLQTLCGLTIDPQERRSIEAAWFAVNRCVRDGQSITPAVQTEMELLHGLPEGNIATQQDRVERLERNRDRVERSLASFRAERAQMQSRFDRNRPLREAFDEMHALAERWPLGIGLLVNFPPTLLELPLAFTSGAFGALLIALVITVYPHSGIAAAAAGGVWRRTLLGGLIALCVYIVLLGGTAVLRTPDVMQSGVGNYMTFSAIGILAGMFSDRVAAWLSTRASLFFGDPRGDAGQEELNVSQTRFSDSPTRGS